MNPQNQDAAILETGNDTETNPIDLGREPERMNWMKSASLGKAIFVEAVSVSHVQEIVSDKTNYPSPIRPAGQILSPTSICSNDGGTTVSTLKLNRIHGIQYVQVPDKHDQGGETIPCLDVECGTTLRDAQMYAHRHSLELPFAGENGMATIGGSCFAVVKDSSIGLPPIKGMGLGDVASMLWSVDIVQSDGLLKTYYVMNRDDNDDDEEEGTRQELFNEFFQGLLDSYGTQGIAVRMLLTLRPKTPTTTTLRVFPFKNNDTSNSQQCANILLETWEKASDSHGNILGMISNRKKYVLVEERIPTENAKHTFAPFSFILVHFYHWLKRIIIQSGSPPLWINFLQFLSGSFLLRFNTPCRRPGNYYDDIPMEQNKVTFTFASFPMDEFTEIATSLLDFIHSYETNYAFTPQGMAMYVINISGQRIAGPFLGSKDEYRFCFDPIHNKPNDEEWESFLIAFNNLAKKKGGRPCLNQTLMLDRDNSYGALAISSDHTSPRFVSSWLENFLVDD